MTQKGLCFVITAVIIAISLLALSASLIKVQTVTAAAPVPTTEPEPVSLAFVESEMLAPTYTGCGGVTAPVVSASYEQEVVELVNQVRADNGLPPLKQVTELTDSARYHATDMGQDDYFDHDTYDRIEGNLVLVCNTWERIQSFYPSPSAENIAAGYSSPQSVMNGWMNSTGHRNNILSTYNWEIGVGYYTGSGSWGRYWVQNFGRRSSSGVYPLIINREAATTELRDVSLYIYGTWDEVRLRNDNDPWTDWQPFQSTLAWTLSGLSGERTVWAEMRSDGETATSNDTIYLDLPAVPPTSVSISGPTTGLVGADHILTAAVSPPEATQPITYVWQTQGQPQVTHIGGLSDTVIFTWDTHGTQAITVTVTNSGGTAIGTHAITISAIPLTSVNISGPTTGFLNTFYTFSASADPVTVTQPITYVWQTHEQPMATHTGGLSDTVNFAWSTTGVQTITITASNAAGTIVTDTHTVTITTGPSIVISQTVGGTLVYTDGQGNATTVSVPANAVTGVVTLYYIPLTRTKIAPPAFAFANHAFILEAHWNGTLLLSFARPITVTVRYSDADVTAINEDSLTQYYWNGADWINAATTCSPSLVFGPQPDENWLTTTVCRLGEFALFGKQWRIYLPLVVRGG